MVRGTGCQPITPRCSVTEPAYSAKHRDHNRATLVYGYRVRTPSVSTRGGLGSWRCQKFADGARGRKTPQLAVGLSKPQITIAADCNHPWHYIVLKIIGGLAS